MKWKVVRLGSGQTAEYIPRNSLTSGPVINVEWTFERISSVSMSSEDRPSHLFYSVHPPCEGRRISASSTLSPLYSSGSSPCDVRVRRRRIGAAPSPRTRWPEAPLEERGAGLRLTRGEHDTDMVYSPGGHTIFTEICQPACHMPCPELTRRLWCRTGALPA